MEEVFLFIDGSNFYNNLKYIVRRTKIDYAKFASKICAEIGNKLNRSTLFKRAYYYNAPVDASADPVRAQRQQRFLDSLRFTTNYRVRLGRLEKRDVKCPFCRVNANIVCPSCGKTASWTYIQKEVDVMLAVDMLSFARNDLYDTAVLVTGDGDFASVLNELVYMNKTTVFAGFHKTMSLRQASDIFIQLDAAFFTGI